MIRRSLFLVVAWGFALMTVAPGTEPDAPAADRKPAREARLPTRPPAQNVNLAGKWLMTLPAGFEHVISLTDIGHGRYRLEPSNLNSAGVYLVRDGRFVLEEANDRADQGYVYDFLNPNVMVLTEEPGNRGSRYYGATLSRLIAPENDRPAKRGNLEDGF